MAATDDEGIASGARESRRSPARVQTIRDEPAPGDRGSGRDDRSLLMCGLTGAHALLVGVPGLAKTLMVKALASAFQLEIRTH